MRIAILDYDDTLFPTTSYLQYEKDNRLDSFKREMAEIDQRLCSFLERLEKKYKIVIVSNGEYRWIIESATEYMPYVARKFKDYQIVSARDAYGNTKDENYELWKPSAIMHYVTDPQIAKSVTNIMGIGDSKNDREAIVQASSYIGKPYMFFYLRSGLEPKQLLSSLNDIERWIAQS